MTPRERLEKELYSKFNFDQLKQLVLSILNENLENYVIATNLVQTVFEFLNQLERETNKLIGFLLNLHEKTNYPELRVAINEYLYEITGVKIPKVDPYSELVISGEAFVNRQNFRDQLRNLFANHINQLLSVRGPRYSGRSHSRILIRHAASKENIEVMVIDLLEYSVDDIIAAFVGEMRLSANDLRDRMAQASSRVKGFIFAFRGIARDFVASNIRWCIIFDHHDLPEVNPEVKELVETLLKDVAVNNIPNVIIIILGAGNWTVFPRNLHYKMQEVTIFPLNSSEVESYLDNLDTLKNQNPSKEEKAKRIKIIFDGLSLPLNLEGMRTISDRLREYIY